MKATINYLETRLAEIRDRRKRIAELGGDLERDNFIWVGFPYQEAVGLIDDLAESYRVQQETLEREAFEAAGGGSGRPHLQLVV